MEQKPTENKMGVMPVSRLLFSMAVPMMVSMLFQAFYNIVDSYFVAKLSEEALTAVGLAFPLQLLLISFSVGTGVGINAVLSRALGEKRFDLASRTANTGIFLYICTALVFSAIGILGAKGFMAIQKADAVVKAYGTEYVKVCIGCSFFLFGQMCFERLLQSTGRTDLAMIPQIVGACINMVLDPLFIFGYAGFPRLEVTGAAVATIFGQAAATLLGIFLNLRYNREVRLSLREIRFHAKVAADIYRIGVPSIVVQSIGSVMCFGMNTILGLLSQTAVAVFTAYFKLQSFFFMPMFGLNNAMVPILSYNYGAARPDRLKKAFRLALISAVSIMAAGCLLFELLPGTLMGIFEPTDAMLEMGRTALRIIGLHFPLAAVTIMGGSACQAIGNPRHALLVSVCRQLVVLLPAAYLLSLSGRVELVWLAFPIAELVSLVLTVIFLRRTFREADRRFPGV